MLSPGWKLPIAPGWPLGPSSCEPLSMTTWSLPVPRRIAMPLVPTIVPKLTILLSPVEAVVPIDMPLEPISVPKLVTVALLLALPLLAIETAARCAWMIPPLSLTMRPPSPRETPEPAVPDNGAVLSTTPVLSTVPGTSENEIPVLALDTSPWLIAVPPEARLMPDWAADEFSIVPKLITVATAPGVGIPDVPPA